MTEISFFFSTVLPLGATAAHGVWAHLLPVRCLSSTQPHCNSGVGKEVQITHPEVIIFHHKSSILEEYFENLMCLNDLEDLHLLD